MTSVGNKKTVKFIFTAQIHRLSIKKNIKFLTKIVWKRHTNKTQTQLQQHEHGFSTFNQKVQLEINLVWDQDKQLYQDKNTEIVAVIQFEGKVKSGGYVKYNIAQVVNNNLKNKLQTIPLSQCPDPNAFVEITFDYIATGQNLDTSMSVLNVSSRDLNMSRIDFNDDKLSLEINRINSTVNKLNDLTSKVKNKQNQIQGNLPKLKMTIQMLEGQKSALKKQLQSVQKSTKKLQQEHHEQKMSMLKQISQLQKQLEKKNKQIKSQHHIELQGQKNNNSNKYKKMYEQALEEIQELKSINMKEGLNFKANFDDVQEIAHFDNSDEEQRGDSKNKVKKVGQNSKVRDTGNISKPSGSQISAQQQLTVQQLKKKNEELQQNLATMSYKLASLFNASFQFGGAQLLDFLQTSIGLTEKN